MKKIVIRTVAIALMMLGAIVFGTPVNAEEETSNRTSLTLSPVSRTLQINSNSSYDGVMHVTNDGEKDIMVQVYATPYSYVYSENEDSYKLGFNNDNNFTQISRWIKIKDSKGNYTTKPTFTIKPKETLNVEYKITTPDNIPAGGQYAVLFAQTVSGQSSSGGIRTEASAGMIIYGRCTEGEIQVSPEFRDMIIGQGLEKEKNGEVEKNNNFYASAKVKNTGNVDFYAQGILKAEPIIGFSSYETPSDKAVVSVIPESEQTVRDEWEETPTFGIYKISWTVNAGETSESIERIVILISPIVAIITIIVLTIGTIGVILGLKKRKARRSRLAI